MFYRRLAVDIWRSFFGLTLTLGLFIPYLPSYASEVDCVEAMRQQTPHIPFSGPYAVDYLELYDHLEQVIYVYPKTEGKEDFSLYLFTDQQVYKIKFKPTSQTTFLVTARNPGPVYFQVRNTKGKILSVFRSEILSPLDKSFSIYTVPVEKLDMIKEDQAVEKVTAELLSGSQLAAAKASFIKSYWPVWEQSIPSESGLKRIFGSSEESWKTIKDSCGSFFDKIEVDEVCHPNQVCGKIIPKSANPDSNDGDEKDESSEEKQEEN